MHTRTTPSSRERVTQGEIFARCPAVLQANWAEAKRLAGQPISADRMARLAPAHLTEQTAPALDIGPRNALEEQIRPYMESSLRKVRARAAALCAGPDTPDGGDAA